MAITLDGTNGITDANGGTVLNTTATQTLTNKTLTAPTITGGSLSGTSGIITQGTAVASTSGTAIDFTGIPSWAKRITVMYSGLSTSGTNIVQLRLGISSGFVSTGYSSFYQQGTTTSNISTGIAICPFTTASTTNSGSFKIENLSGNNWVISGINGVSSPSVSISAGSISLSDVLDRIRITMVSDSFDAGTINIMYEG